MSYRKIFKQLKKISAQNLRMAEEIKQLTEEVRRLKFSNGIGIGIPFNPMEIMIPPPPATPYIPYDDNDDYNDVIPNVIITCENAGPTKNSDVL